MGKASSSKKVARAAGTGGGRTSGKRVPWSYYGVIAVMVVAGVSITATSRSSYVAKLHGQTAANATVAPKIGGTPWNEGYAVDICGHFAAPLDVPNTRTGISTAGRGVIHIAPKVPSAAGRNATLGVFATSVGMHLSATEVGLPHQRLWTSGDTCSGKPAEVYVKQFAYAGAPVGSLLHTDPRSVRLQDQALVTIAFVPPADKGSIPAPPASVQKALEAATAAATPTTTAPTTPAPTTTPTTVAPAKSSPTTAKGTAGSTTKGTTSTGTATTPGSTKTSTPPTT